jgi:hypothetical protein
MHNLPLKGGEDADDEEEEYHEPKLKSSPKTPPGVCFGRQTAIQRLDVRLIVVLSF